MKMCNHCLMSSVWFDEFYYLEPPPCSSLCYSSHLKELSVTSCDPWPLISDTLIQPCSRWKVECSKTRQTNKQTCLLNIFTSRGNMCVDVSITWGCLATETGFLKQEASHCDPTLVQHLVTESIWKAFVFIFSCCFDVTVLLSVFYIHNLTQRCITHQHYIQSEEMTFKHVCGSILTDN